MQQKGFTSIVIIAVVAFLGLGAIIYTHNNKDNAQSSSVPEQATETPMPTTTDNYSNVVSTNTPIPTSVQKTTKTPTPLQQKPATATQTPTVFVPTSTPTPKPLAYPTSRPGITCEVYANPSQGQAPLSVQLAYSAGYDSDKKSVTGVQWDYDGDGNWDTDESYKTALTHTYTNKSEFYVGMKVIITDSVTSATDVCYASRLIKVQ